MSSTAATPEVATSSGTFTGHPRGLYLLFFTEMWERFCYYGMRALLALYVAAAFTHGNQEEAALKYGAFTALVYATGIFGGAIADKLLGYQRAIMCGGIFIAAGEFTLLIPQENAFLFGLALMIVGNGLFKPNISSIVGKLYQPGDIKRDQGFTIFYMGINLGALLAPLACDQIRAAFTSSDPAATTGFRYAFACAGAGMLLGIVNFLFGRHRLGEHGKPPAGKEGLGLSAIVMIGGVAVAGLCYVLLSKEAMLEYILYALLLGSVLYVLKVGFDHDLVQRQRLYALLFLLFANIIFWAIYEQAGNSLNFFAENLVDRNIFGLFEFKTGWYQSVNPLMIVVLAPVFVWLWSWLDRRSANPSIPGKFGWALMLDGAGFLVLVVAVRFAYTMVFKDQSREVVGFYWLFITYLMQTMGELCLSPIGLSMVTKLAPPKLVGFTMGAWFMSISIGNFLAGKISAVIGGKAATASAVKLSDYSSVFSPIGWIMLGIGVVVLIAAPKVNRWMHGVK